MMRHEQKPTEFMRLFVPIAWAKRRVGTNRPGVFLHRRAGKGRRGRSTCISLRSRPFLRCKLRLHPRHSTPNPAQKLHRRAGKGGRGRSTCISLRCPPALRCKLRLLHLQLTPKRRGKLHRIAGKGRRNRSTCISLRSLPSCGIISGCFPCTRPQIQEGSFSTEPGWNAEVKTSGLCALSRLCGISLGQISAGNGREPRR